MRVLFGVCVLTVAGMVASCSTPLSEPTAEEVRTRYIEVALECEFGQCPEGAVLPAGSVSVTILGEARDDQRGAVVEAVSQWNSACSRFPITFDGPTEVGMQVIFWPQDDLGSVLDVYVEGNSGMFNYDWDKSGEITAITVGIANELDGRQLRHFVLEEITQSLGLKNDVSDPTSIFDAGTSAQTTYSALDSQTIKLHCSPGIFPGMRAEEVPQPNL